MTSKKLIIEHKIMRLENMLRFFKHSLTKYCLTYTNLRIFASIALLTDFTFRLLAYINR